MKKLLNWFIRVSGFIPSSLVLVFSLTTVAQQKVTGIVNSIDGLPLAGATVVIKGTNEATTTASDGSFIITAKTGDVLELSFIGHQSRQINIDNEIRFFKLSLSESITNLDEIVVTGYTSQRIKEISGSVAIVKPKDLTAVPAGQVEQMLQGRVAGLSVITSGEPGSPSNIRLHGIGNFGDVTPLYIIDGVEGNINSLNPYDIESLQVLKDAGTYSIYGVRGANGVVVITTKKGESGRTKINYDFYMGATRPLKKGLDLLSPQESADLLWLSLRNSGLVTSNGNPSHRLYGNGPTPVLPDYLTAGPYVGLLNGDSRADSSLYNIDAGTGPIYQIVPFNKTGTDWFHETFKPALSQSHTVTLSGGNENSYLLSFGYLDQQGTYLNTYLKRFTTRINTEFKLFNAIRIGENLQLNYSRNPRVENLIYPSLETDPYLPLYDIKGNRSSYGSAQPGGLSYPTPAGNPVAVRELSKDDKDNNWQIFGNAFADVDVLNKLTLRSSFGGTLNYYYAYNYAFGSYAPPPNGINSSLSERSGYGRSWTWTTTLTFSETFGNKHQFKALVGTEQKSNYNREQGGSRNGYFTNDPNYRFLSTGNPNGQSNYSVAGTSYLSSFISQVNYGYKEKYIISGTLRRDGSSIFGPENRFGWFPAVAVAWRATEENFMKNIEWIDELKLRASWGKSGYYGNTDPFNQYTLYGGGPGGSYFDINGTSNSIQQGFRLVRIGNAKTGWQEDIGTNIGIESFFWNGKLSITADWYNKKSKGLLFPVSLPALLGDATPPNANVGNINNTGVDITLGSKGRFSKNWSWDLLATFSSYRNKIVKLNDLTFFDDWNVGYGNLIRNEVGHPSGSFYGYKVIGFFQDDADVARSPLQDAAAPGRFKYADVNGRDSSTNKLTGKPDGKITTDDRFHYGNPNPKFTLGLNIGLTYRNFDFSTFFYGSFGNDLLNYIRFRTDIPDGGNIKSKTALYHSWTPQRLNSKAPIAENNPNFSNVGAINSYSLEKGTYFRNKTMMLGFTFSKDWVQKFRIDRLRIYIQVANLFTITNYKGLDPELSGIYGRNLIGPTILPGHGIDFGSYPNNEKKWLIGLNLGF